jgi:hypothetical protein
VGKVCIEEFSTKIFFSGITLMDLVPNLRGTIAPSSRSNFGGGGRQIAEKRIARSRPRKRDATKPTSNKQRRDVRFSFKLAA